MIIAMFLAHIVGDYILQWNSLAAWKAREMRGVTVHCIIVLFVALAFVLPIDPNWWPWVLFIGIMHFLIDAVQLKVRVPFSPLARFTLDQFAHFAVIVVALAAGGYLDLGYVGLNMQMSLQSDRLLLFLLAYAFITMPAWVVVKFTAYGLVNGSAPDFAGDSKYLAMLERVLITTFVALGQFFLVPLVMLPRLVMEWPTVVREQDTAVYLAELLASVTLAVAVGVLLSFLIV